MGKIELKNPLPEGTTPWDLMQAFDAKRFGEDVFDLENQKRWATAIFVGGLPYMWRKAYVVLDMIYNLCELEEGSKVFLIGESLESCGFIDDIKRRIGASGELTAIDNQEECRDAMFHNKVGRGGQRGTFKYDYCKDIPDNSYDAVLNLQAIQHADDWTEAGAEFVRILKPGRRLVMAEIILGGPEQIFKIKQDLHLDHLITKIMSRIATRFEDFPYYSPGELKDAFKGMLEDMDEFEWRGLEVFWGRKPG
ncbi:methyltransferase domain-containing protein [Chelativorans salis]|uniref:Methyltransferase domain-containing protein n=1 Tax=Chelativorans salis TaxID=2978478 RepID=A0ABT2LVK4_9HYPH|nr:methyltransferase domain-containing protein [Chelativorans sp. EGI FJ00035]MCT7378134.1 methyltransferase domain-containing protein [Chelativorans sp. EGI FJ00035]